MRKFITCLLSALLTILCLLTCVGCSFELSLNTPRLNIHDADVALRDKGYDVEIEYGKVKKWDAESFAVKKVLYAEKGELSIEIYEFEKKSTAKVVYDYYKAECETELTYAQAVLDYDEHLLENYRYLYTSELIADLEEEIVQAKEYIRETKEELKTFGRNGVFVWFASDVDVIKDAK